MPLFQVSWLSGVNSNFFGGIIQRVVQYAHIHKHTYIVRDFCIKCHEAACAWSPPFLSTHRKCNTPGWQQDFPLLPPHVALCRSAGHGQACKPHAVTTHSVFQRHTCRHALRLRARGHAGHTAMPSWAFPTPPLLLHTTPAYYPLTLKISTLLFEKHPQSSLRRSINFLLLGF